MIQLAPFTPLGAAQQLSVSGTAQSLPSPPRGYSAALIQVSDIGSATDETQAVRLSIGSNDPTASLGFILGKNDYFWLTNYDQVTNAKIISVSGNDQTVEIQYFKGVTGQ